MFQSVDLLNTSFALDNLYLVMGLSDSFRVKVSSCNSSNNAPSNALVDGGYFRNFTRINHTIQRFNSCFFFSHINIKVFIGEYMTFR